MADACISADDTWDPAAFCAMVFRRRTPVSKDPYKPSTIPRELQDSPAYANLLEKPKGWVAPSAVAPLPPLADGLPGNASAATSAGGLGKGGKGGTTGKDFKKAAGHRAGRRTGKMSDADADGGGA